MIHCCNTSIALVLHSLSHSSTDLFHHGSSSFSSFSTLAASTGKGHMVAYSSSRYELTFQQNPHDQLEQLRKTSLALKPESLAIHAKNVPRRDMPRSSVDMTAAGSAGSSPNQAPKVEHHVHFKESGLGPVSEEEKEAGSQSKGGEVRTVAGNGSGNGASGTRSPGGVRFGAVAFGEEKEGGVGREEVVSPTG